MRVLALAGGKHYILSACQVWLFTSHIFSIQYMVFPVPKSQNVGIVFSQTPHSLTQVRYVGKDMIKQFQLR